MLINKYNSATGLESDTSPTLAVIIRAVLKLDMGGQGGGRGGCVLFFLASPCTSSVKLVSISIHSRSLPAVGWFRGHRALNRNE